jgi:hypothetical protein
MFGNCVVVFPSRIASGFATYVSNNNTEKPYQQFKPIFISNANLLSTNRKSIRIDNERHETMASANTSQVPTALRKFVHA